MYPKIVVCLLLLAFQLATAQKDSTYKKSDLAEIIISANKFEQLKKESPNQIEIITSKKIAFQNTANTANLLEQSGNVFVQRSQAGGGSPILRGLESSRVLIVVDGIRMNNAIYRSGHLQNVMRIDQNMLDRAEVIFGPSSVMYGSDALGGVINFRSKSPELNKTNANGYVRYASAFGEKTAHIDLNLGRKRFGSLTSFTISDFGDLIQGSKRSEKYPNFGKRTFYVERQNEKDISVPNENENKQIGSTYSQHDFFQKFSFQQSKKINHILNFQYSNSSDVPRYDRLTEIRNGVPRFAEWYYGPEKRMMLAYQLELKDEKIYDKAFFSAAFQNINESRISRRFNNVNRKSQMEEVEVFSINADFQKTLKNNSLNYGLEIVLNNVSSVANFKNIITNLESKADTRYPDGTNRMNSWAVYLSNQLRINDKVILNSGLRYNSTNLSSEFIEKAFFPFPFNTIEQKTAAMTGNLGLVYNPSTKTKISLIGSSGFRTPNIDDLAKVFDTVPGVLVVPNPSIKPEYTYNMEASIHQKIGKKFTIEATYFNSIFQNAIVIDAFTLNGQSTVLFNNVISKVMAAQNKSKAFINGWNLAIYGKVTSNITFSSSLNQTKGKIDDDKNTPLDHIPPLFGRSSLKFQKEALQIEVFSLYNGWKKLIEYSPSGEDNLIYATSEGMPSWTTFNIRMAYQIKRNLSIQLACENIFDRNYRNFASGISSAGRNFMITVRSSI